MAEKDTKGEGGGAHAPKHLPAPGPDERTIIRAVESDRVSPPVRSQYQPPYMVVVEGPRTGSRFPLGDGPNIVGRAPGNAIRLEDQSVSRQHSEITKGLSGWMVKDLGSKNGTLVNGKLIAEAVVIGHKDFVKTGIYQLRLITQPMSLEEEMTLPPDLAMPDRTVFVAAPPDSLTSEMLKKEAPAEKPQPSLPAEEGGKVEEGEGEEFEGEEGGGVEKVEMVPEVQPEKPAAKPGAKRQLVMVAVLALVSIIAIAYFANRFFFKPHKVKKPAHAAAAAEEALPEGTALQPQDLTLEPPPEPPQAPPGQLPAAPQQAGQQMLPAVPTLNPAQPLARPVHPVPVFLDFASSPMPTKVTFEDKELGMTPLRINAQLSPGRSYQARALFVMPEIQQQYTQESQFAVEKDQSVVPILFRAPIGMLKVMNLPRDVQFYLEGKFSYEKFQEQTAKLQGIVLQKPIYIPYGNYSLELRRSRQMGETSPTFVSGIIFRREFTIAQESPTYTLEVKDEDLTVFPVKIRSDPPNADVFVDGKAVGKTPFEGIFPLGEHKLTLRKEGYFEHSEDLKVDVNTPFAAEVKLKTSVAGAHLNNARQAMGRAMYQEAINELAEALNSSPAPTEVALSNYLLGQCYLKAGDVQRAIGYFTQARESETQRYPAILGLATSYAMLQQMNQALPLLVEVMLKTTDDETKRAAHGLFQKMSPFHSVIYVYSEPPGAQVTVNDKPVAQQTPVILHELPLGNYRLRVDKTGFLPTEMNLSLSVNEFNPVIVKLKPIPQ
ncbi:MAG: PEGA domain-containing protein [Pseudomonadota bacterium]